MNYKKTQGPRIIPPLRGGGGGWTVTHLPTRPATKAVQKTQALDELSEILELETSNCPSLFLKQQHEICAHQASNAPVEHSCCQLHRATLTKVFHIVP